LTFLGALRCDQLTASSVFDSPINGARFREKKDCAIKCRD